MLDIRLIRENPDAVRADLKKRGDTASEKFLEELIEKDERARELKTELQKAEHQRNEIGKEISAAKRAGKDVSERLKQVAELVKKIESGNKEHAALEKRVREILLRLPNILQPDVPTGKSEDDNVELRRWGKPPKFKFKPRGHEEIGLALDGIDIERAAKISGARFYFLKNDLARLDLALQNFAVDFLLKKGFSLFQPPLMMRRGPYEGVTALEDFETMMYKVEGEDLYLIATSEHPAVAMFQGEVIDEKSLPLKLVGVSACFRKEAGAHGKDTKGIFRVHQFNKIEQVILCKPEEAKKLHEELIKNAEELFKRMGLPFRVVNVCTGDIGTVASKKYDLEVWLPAQERYREMASCSNVTDYQARRLNIKYGKYGAVKGLVATLNSTAIATSRAIVAILENFQQADGSVTIPAALQKYMGGIKRLFPKAESKAPKATKKSKKQ